MSATGNISAQYDTSVLDKRRASLVNFLFGNGSGDGQAQQVLKTETGQLMGRMGDAAGPKSQSAAMAKVTKEMKGHLAILPKAMNLNQESESYAEFTWLYASPHALLGINDEDNQIRASGEQAYQMLRAGQKSTPRGLKYVELGKRGKQKIMRLNRVRVSQPAFNQVRRIIADKTGQLRASFYRIAKLYVPSKRVPAWVEKKFGDVEANGKSVVSESLMSTPDADILITITAAGVASNPRLTSKFQGAINASAESLKAKLAKLAKGAKYVWETGQVYFPKNGEDN